jgi:hypothetical protein
MWFPDDEFGGGVLVQVAQVLSARYPPLDNPLKLCKTIGQRGGTGLQDQWRLYLVHILALHGRSSVETRPHHHPLRPELLAAPRANDQIRFSYDHLVDAHHAILGGGPAGAVGEDVVAAGDLDELRDPADPRAAKLRGP